MSTASAKFDSFSTARLFLFCVILAASTICAGPAKGQLYEDQILVPSSQTLDCGTSLSIYDDVAITGAPGDGDNGTAAGAVFVYRFDPGLKIWNEEAKLLASDGSSYGLFGTSINLQGNTALIGAYGDDQNGSYSGSVYMFEYDSGSGTWNETGKFSPSDCAADDYFGLAVARQGDLALIGAPGDEGSGPESGSAYLFRYDPGSGTWNEEAKLIPSDGSQYQYFGYSLSLDGDTALIGSYHDDDNGWWSGSAYVYRYDPGSGTWTEEAKLLASTGDSGDRFGNSVALDGDTAFIGAEYDSYFYSNAGAVYVFEYDPGSGTWSEEARLFSSDGGKDDNFGYSIFLSGETALIGAPDMGVPPHERGAAYQFGYDSGSGTWTEEVKMVASDGEDGDLLGRSVFLSDTHLMVGARGDEDGSVYFYDLADYPPDVDIKANGSDGTVTIGYGTQLTVETSIDPGVEEGNDADWWYLVDSPFGWYYHRIAIGDWRPGFKVTQQGGLHQTGPDVIYNGTGLPRGRYIFYFGVDMDMDGQLDIGQAYYDYVVVRVQ